jgi:hypothetical protein
MRFTVIPNPAGRARKGGYAIHDANPSEITCEDVEGVGLVHYSPPYRRRPSVTCWFKRKRDAQAHADMLNRKEVTD